MASKTLSRKERTAATIDIRMHELMLLFLQTEGDISIKEFMGFMRSAYVQGYTDCLKEDAEERGQWIKNLGYGVTGVQL